MARTPRTAPVFAAAVLAAVLAAGCGSSGSPAEEAGQADPGTAGTGTGTGAEHEHDDGHDDDHGHGT